MDYLWHDRTGWPSSRTAPPIKDSVAHQSQDSVAHQSQDSVAPSVLENNAQAATSAVSTAAHDGPATAGATGKDGETPPRPLFHPVKVDSVHAEMDRLRLELWAARIECSELRGQLEARSERALEEERAAGARGAREEAQRQVEELRGEVAAARRETERARRYHEEEVAVLLGAHRDKEALWQRKEVELEHELRHLRHRLTDSRNALSVAEACAQGVREEGSSAVAVLRGQLAGALRAAAEREREQREAMALVDGDLARLQAQADAAAQREELAVALIDRLRDDNEALRAALHRREEGGRGSVGAGSGWVEQERSRWQADGAAERVEEAVEGKCVEQVPGGAAWRDMVQRSKAEAPLGDGSGDADGDAKKGEAARRSRDNAGGDSSGAHRGQAAAGGGGAGRAEMAAGSKAWGRGGACEGAGDGRVRASAVGAEEPGATEPGGDSDACDALEAHDDSAGRVEETQGREYESTYTLPVPRKGAWSRAKEAVARYYDSSGGEGEGEEQREREVEQALEENGRLQEQVRALQAQVARSQRAVASQGRVRQRVLQLRVCLELTTKVVDVKDRALEVAVQRARAAEARCAHLDRQLQLQHQLTSRGAAGPAAPAAVCERCSTPAAIGAEGSGGIREKGLASGCRVAEIGAVDEEGGQGGRETGAGSRQHEGVRRGEASPDGAGGADEEVGVAAVEADQADQAVSTGGSSRRAGTARRGRGRVRGGSEAGGEGEEWPAVGLKELQARRDELLIAMHGLRERAALAAEMGLRAAAVLGRRGSDKRGQVREMLAEVEGEADEARALIERTERIVHRMAALERRGKALERKMETKRVKLVHVENKFGLAPRSAGVKVACFSWKMLFQ
ncbi:hypothetical protein CLOM_g16960 [Closterium sp. NIES-68]|nr:hypothetical protein CLOM_g16960 [Closterium sp. NIES-68]GJP86452.1 hypothetical protein CLOP_g16477 [Closterium sp. NIES-67]